MKSGPVLLLLIAFGVLYLAATGRLATFVELLQQTGEGFTDPDADESVPADPADLSRVPDYIGGVGGRGMFYNGAGWSVV